MPKITVKISQVGDARIDVDGVAGTSCVNLTASVEAALAGTPAQREYKPEYDEVSIDQPLENG